MKASSQQAGTDCPPDQANNRFKMVTHYGISSTDIDYALENIKRIIKSN